jgi:serine/threonine-protein kinase
VGVLHEVSLHWVIEQYAVKGLRIPTELCVKIGMECCIAVQNARHLERPGTRPLICPSTLLLSRDGYVRLLGPEGPLRRGEPYVGQFNYLSPEAACGLRIDERFDVYVLGAVLWELLAGRVLFKGDTDYQTVERVRQGSIPPLAVLNPEVDAQLEAILRTALAKDPADRYENVGAFAAALSRYASMRGIMATDYDLRAVIGDIG